MTVIVGLAREGRVTMGADTANTVNNTHIYGTRKIVRRASIAGVEMLFGVTGNGALVPLIQQVDVTSGWDENPDRWALNLARALTKEADRSVPRLLLPPDDNHIAEQFDGTVLLGMSGRLWILLANMTIAYTDGIAAIGAGHEVALGYLLCGRDLTEAPPEQLVRLAVLAACQVIPWCGVDSDGPYILEIGARS